MKERTFNILFRAAIAAQVAFVIAAVWLTWIVVTEVQEHGLRGVIEQIWEGPNADE